MAEQERRKGEARDDELKFGMPSPWTPAQADPRAAREAFQGALTRISVLHNQEVQALQTQVLELRQCLKQLKAASILDANDKALTREAAATEVTTEYTPELTAETTASGRDGPWDEVLGSTPPAASHGNGRHVPPAMLSSDTGTEPHPCAKPHKLPETFWKMSSPPAGPGARAPDSFPKEDDLLCDNSVVLEEKTKVGGNMNGSSSLPLQEAGPAATLAVPKDPDVEKTGSDSQEAHPRRRSVDDVMHSAELQQHMNSMLKELEQYSSPAAKRMQQLQQRPGHRSSHQIVKRWSLLWLIEHRVFDFLCAMIIIMNSVLVGCNVVWHTTHNDKNILIQTGSHFCSAFFLTELCLRMYCHGCRKFFTAEGRGWNTFDFMLVVSSGFDILLSQMTNSEASVDILNTGMKTIKIMRIVRVFRVFRFFKELSLLALMIVDSMKSLGWAIVMVMIVVYVFAILFTDNAVEYIKVVGNDPFHAHYHMLPELSRWFGSLSVSTYTLVQSTLGGVSWGVVSDVLIDYDKPMAFLFFFYQAFTILAVLNIITGVFVDNAVETAQTQREFLVQKEMELKEKYVGEMKNLFEEMDSDGNGTVTMEEIQEYLMDTRIMSYFQALGLDPNDTERLFRLIDDDQSGGISVDEFLAGCLRLKGQARSIDIHALLHDLKKLFARFEKMERLIEGKREDEKEEGDAKESGLLGSGL